MVAALPVGDRERMCRLSTSVQNDKLVDLYGVGFDTNPEYYYENEYLVYESCLKYFNADDIKRFAEELCQTSQNI